MKHAKSANSIYALIVGIEHYDQFGWDVTGPCANALEVARWLRGINVPSDNITMFLQPKERGSVNKTVEDLGLNTPSVPSFINIDTHWRVNLPKLPPESNLLVYWSGHGYTDNDGARILICCDFTADELVNRVFNASNFLRHLRSTRFLCIPDQMLLADVCGVHSRIKFSADKVSPEDQTAHTRQIGFFATPEGDMAKGGYNGGEFTKLVLEVLKGVAGWPNSTSFATQLEQKLRNENRTCFRISGLTPNWELAETLIGQVQECLTQPSNLALSFERYGYYILFGVRDWNGVFLGEEKYIRGGHFWFQLAGYLVPLKQDIEIHEFECEYQVKEHILLQLESELKGAGAIISQEQWSRLSQPLFLPERRSLRIFYQRRVKTDAEANQMPIDCESGTILVRVRYRNANEAILRTARYWLTHAANGEIKVNKIHDTIDDLA